MTHAFKTPGITRAGFEFQDLASASILIDFYIDPKKYSYVTLERTGTDFEALDDVVCARTDATFELYQVKFTVDPDRSDLKLDWKWLLSKRRNGKSLLEKWSTTALLHLNQSTLSRAALITNRAPDEGFRKVLGDNNRIEFDEIESDIRQTVIEQLGSENIARKFFENFQFVCEQRSIDAFEINQKARVCPSSTDQAGWLYFRNRISRWATRKNEPRPGGRIEHKDLVRVLSTSRPKPIPQSFEIPNTFVSPSPEFERRLVVEAMGGTRHTTVIWGTPGRGKSTFLSHFKTVLEAEQVPVIRHHYYLSARDMTEDRCSYSVVASSLLDQLRQVHPEGDVSADDGPDDFVDRLRTSAEFFKSKGKPLVVIIDGLDHVWRELRSAQHLQQLFSRVFPLPKNVKLFVGTQKVPDTQLPSRLLTECPKSDWRELPLLGYKAVEEWLRIQDSAGRIGVPEHADENYFDDLVVAFQKVSDGHPLHLVYSFERSSRMSAELNPEDVLALPDCPEGDIEKYYLSLWTGLSNKAKSLLITATVAGFNFPKLVDLCTVSKVDRFGDEIAEIDFLLEQKRSELAPFHSSVPAFIAKQIHLEEHELEVLANVSSWLSESAPAYWKWAWFWIVEHRRGNSVSLVDCPNYDWIVEALRDGAPTSQLIKILSEASTAAFEHKNYARAMTLRHMLFRILNGFEFQLHEQDNLQEVTIGLVSDSSHMALLLNRLTELDEQELVSLAERAKERGDVAVSDEIRLEFDRRQQALFSSRKSAWSDVSNLGAYALKCAGVQDRLNADRLIKYVKQFPDPGIITGKAMRAIVECGDVSTLKSVLSDKEFVDTISYSDLTCLPAYMSCTEQIAWSKLFPGRANLCSPFEACLLIAEGGEELPEQFDICDLEALNRSELSYGIDPTLVRAFEDAFFFGYLEGTEQPSRQPPDVSKWSNPDWEWSVGMYSVLHALGYEMSQNFSTSIEQLYQGLADYEHLRGSYNDQLRRQYINFEYALVQIGLKLNFLHVAISGAMIETIDFDVLSDSAHWNRYAWLSEYIRFGPSIVSEDVASAAITKLEEYHDKYTIQFDERAEQWSMLAALAYKHDLTTEARRLSERVYRCIVGYGYRKDYFVWDVLSSIEHCGKYLGHDTRDMLAAIKPAALNIGEYTDGDETSHVPSEFAQLVAKMTPEDVPRLYRHFVTNEEWSDAQKLLEFWLENADFSQESTVALANTAMDKGGPFLLSQIAERLPNTVEAISSAMTDRVGSQPQSTERDYTSPERESRVEIDVRRFSPDQFENLRSEISDQSYLLVEEATLREWVQYWSDQGAAVTVLTSLEKYFNSTDNFRSLEKLADLLFDIALKHSGKKSAFPWLVRAHVNNYGWSHYGNADAATKRFQKLVEHYPKRIDEFIAKASEPSRTFRSDELYGPVIGGARLVQLLAIAGNQTQAVNCTLQLIHVIKHEISDLPVALQTVAS